MRGGVNAPIVSILNNHLLFLDTDRSAIGMKERPPTEGGHLGLSLGAEGHDQHMLIDLLVLGETAPMAAAAARHRLSGG